MKTENSRAEILFWNGQSRAALSERVDMYYDLLECAADYIGVMPLDKSTDEEMLGRNFTSHRSLQFAEDYQQ